MKTFLLTDERLPAFDREILQNLLISQTTQSDVRQCQFLIGLHDGVAVYRLIGADNTKQYNNAIEELQDLDLIDLLAGRELPDENGFHAIYGENE